jgi:hypothetical protein
MSDKVPLTNEQKIARKASLKKEIEALDQKIGQAHSYRTAQGQPMVGSPELKEAKEQLTAKVSEYNSIIIEIEASTLTMKNNLSFSDTRYVLKYSYAKGGQWQFFDGSDFLSSMVTFNEEGTQARILVPIRNSDTHGELYHYVYTVNITDPKDSVLKINNNPKDRPCGLAEAGLAVMKQNDDGGFMKQCGYVRDAVTKQWRRPTPDEYCATQKPTKQAKPERKKGFGGLFKGRNK